MVSVKTKCFITRWTRYPDGVIFTCLINVFFSFLRLTFFKYTDKMKRPINTFLFGSTNFTVTDNLLQILPHPVVSEKFERYFNSAHLFTLYFEAEVCESCNADIQFRYFSAKDKNSEVLSCRNASMSILMIAMHPLIQIVANMGVQNLCVDHQTISEVEHNLFCANT